MPVLHRPAEMPRSSVTGNLKADSASGGIAVETVMGAASMSTASGDATIGELAGDMKFRAASGSLSVRRLHGTVNAQTASGDVTVRAAVNGGVSVQTGSGDIEVGVEEGTAARLDLRTHSGEVRNNLQPADGPADGDETLHRAREDRLRRHHRAARDGRRRRLATGSNRNTANCPASASNSSGRTLRDEPRAFGEANADGNLHRKLAQYRP